MEHPMRAFYSTQKHIRAFVLGTPEGWHVSIYDLRKQEWIAKKGWRADTLKQAKTAAQEKTTSLLGEKAFEMKWH
jgi:hypothetical protein